MLKELRCDKFKPNNQCIRFKHGLNTVLGDDIGSNSIGKSTFLLILDYVFGGKSLTEKAVEVFSYLGHFKLYFCFEFDNTEYRFMRDTSVPQTVYFCNENYEPKESKMLDEYNSFLFEKYGITLPCITFRNMVNLFLRVYGKENNDEEKPLNAVKNESGAIAIERLIKLFGAFENIAQLKEAADDSENRNKALTKYNTAFKISSLRASEYKALLKRKESLEKQKDEIEEQSSFGELDLQTEQYEEINKLKQELDALRRIRNNKNSIVKRLRDNKALSSVITDADLSLLASYFPNVDVKKIEEVDQFHKGLSSILSPEIEVQINLQAALLLELNEQIKDIQNKIKSIANCKSPSAIIINKILQISKEIDSLKERTDSYSQVKNCKEEMKSTKKIYTDAKGQSMALIQHSLNVKMNEINSFVYSPLYKSPYISFSSTYSSYTLSTQDDRGTGTNYKNLIVFDLAMLELTQVPILIHDSIILKQIADEAIAHIIQKYYSNTDKQIFIALDKQSSYFKDTSDILEQCKVLELSPKEEALFGESWSIDKQ